MNLQQVIDFYGSKYAVTVAIKHHGATLSQSAIGRWKEIPQHWLYFFVVMVRKDAEKRIADATSMLNLANSAFK